jgi:hypothetical protein
MPASRSESRETSRSSIEAMLSASVETDTRPDAI